MSRRSDFNVSELRCLEKVGSNNRKVRKPLMEKKRRARINQSLNDLKDILLNSGTALKESSRPNNKLEKADILELTVNYINQLRQEQLVSFRKTADSNCCSSCSSIRRSEPTGASAKFKAGFRKCAHLVHEVLNQQHFPPAERTITDRVIRQLEPYLACAEKGLEDARQSLSTSSRNDSYSSFEEKDSIICSDSFDQVTFPTGKPSVISAKLSAYCDHTESQHSSVQQSFSSRLYHPNDCELLTPNASPILELHADTSSSSSIDSDSLNLDASPNFNIKPLMSQQPMAFTANFEFFQRQNVCYPSTFQVIQHPHSGASKVWRPW